MGINEQIQETYFTEGLPEDTCLVIVTEGEASIEEYSEGMEHRILWFNILVNSLLYIEETLMQMSPKTVIAGGSPMEDALICDYDTVLSVRDICIRHGISFRFGWTGSYLRKDGRIFRIPQDRQLEQAHKAGIDSIFKALEDPMDRLFDRLSRSKFRSRFRMKESDWEYLDKKGWDTIRDHAEDFVAKRLAPGYIPNDGKQTPMRGHPVFLAQHATGC